MRWAITTMLVFAVLPSAWGQDASDRSESELLKNLRNGSIMYADVEEAWSQLKVAIRERPSDDWHNARTSLARAFGHLQHFDTAIDILKQGFDYHLIQVRQSTSDGDLFCMYDLAQKIAEYASRSSTPQIEAEVLDVVISTLRQRVESSDNMDINSTQLISTLGLRCRTLPPATASQLLESEYERVRGVFEANPDNRFAAFAYVEALKSLAIPPYSGGRPDIDRINELLSFVTGLKEHKDIEKIVWGMQYYDSYLFVLEQILDEHPDDAQRFVTDAIETLKRSGENDVVFERMFDFRIKNLDSMNDRIAAAKKHLKIVGNAAPAFDDVAWVNGEETDLERLAGSVILLDFTAVWCGPCIQQIPDLKKLHETFGNRGLVIISVTEQYDFTWDDEKNAPNKSADTIELAQELKMLEKFVSWHQLPFRLMVIEKGSKMEESLGVSSIPHAVLIDKKGNVSMIRKGNTRANAHAIQHEIEKLLAN